MKPRATKKSGGNEVKQPAQNGSLRIPLPFEDAIRAALEVKPPPKPPRKKREPAKPKPKP
jgi:hypothetical protein